MYSFTALFRNPFSARVTDSELRRFGVTHAGLLLADVHFTGLAGVTREAIENYSGALTDEEFWNARSKAATREREQARELFLDVLGQHEGAIRSKFGKDSFTYVRFFPSGMAGFRDATLDDLDDKVSGFERVLREFANDLPKEVIVSFLGEPRTEPLPEPKPHDPLPVGSGAIARLRHARNAQLAAQGRLVEARSQVARARAALETRLYLNLLHVAGATVDQPEHRKVAAARLFPQHIFGDYLRNNRRKGQEEVQPGEESSASEKTTDASEASSTEAAPAVTAATGTESTSEDTADRPAAPQANEAQENPALAN